MLDASDVTVTVVLPVAGLKSLLPLYSALMVCAPALHAMRGYRAALHGFTALEAAGGYRLPLSKDESFHALVTTCLGGLAVGWQASES